MAVSVALPTRHVLGEGPAWSARDQALYLVDIGARQVLRWRPGQAPRLWTMPEPVSAAIPRRRGGLVLTLASRVALLDTGAGGPPGAARHPRPPPPRGRAAAPPSHPRTLAFIRCVRCDEPVFRQRCASNDLTLLAQTSFVLNLG